MRRNYKTEVVGQAGKRNNLSAANSSALNDACIRKNFTVIRNSIFSISPRREISIFSISPRRVRRFPSSPYHHTRRFPSSPYHYVRRFPSSPYHHVRDGFHLLHVTTQGGFHLLHITTQGGFHLLHITTKRRLRCGQISPGRHPFINRIVHQYHHRFRLFVLHARVLQTLRHLQSIKRHISHCSFSYLVVRFSRPAHQPAVSLAITPAASSPSYRSLRITAASGGS